MEKLNIEPASVDDIKQVEELFMELEDLIKDCNNLDAFEKLVRIELKLEEYRLKQTLAGQAIESAYAVKLESLLRNA
ncbi:MULTISPECIES: hypothetical protein [Listeria]|uniref:hypothetical protein n=1 Tax=Listeria TaxID=1637 RepID=UPI000B58C2DE|nr:MULTISPECIES: hypothetical protein [Listeria]